LTWVFSVKIFFQRQRTQKDHRQRIGEVFTPPSAAAPSPSRRGLLKAMPRAWLEIDAARCCAPRAIGAWKLWY